MTPTGWCPSTHRIHPAPDGGIARVRVPGGRLAPAQLRAVAQAAREVGNGAVDLTVRANLQVRGVADSSAPRLRELLAPVGLSSADAAVEDRLNVIASPTAGFDPFEVLDVGPLVTVAVDTLARLQLPDLPHKFGVLLDGGGTPTLRGIAVDLAIGARRQTDGASTHLEVSLGRSLDARPLLIADVHSLEALVEVTAGICARGIDGRPARLAEVVASAGWAATVERLRGSGDVEVVGVLHTAPTPVGRPDLRPGLHPSTHAGESWLWIGTTEDVVTAGHLDELASLAEECGAGEVRLTPWREVVVPGVRDTDRALAFLSHSGWTISPPRRSETRRPVEALT